MTQEEITAELHKFLATHHENVECDTCLNVFEDLRNLVAEICEEEKVIDWEQRRYEIAKEAMIGILSNEYEVNYACSEAEYSKNEVRTVPKSISRFAVACADALIAELKGGNNYGTNEIQRAEKV